jgi:DNA-directed RNA polymerase specialized sigma24 family protein
MNTSSRSRQNRDITDEEMSRFLSWLDPNAEESGRKYREIHRCLSGIFIRRGYVNAEEMADEAIDRVIRRVARDGSYEGEDRIPYFVRVAYNLHIERQRAKPPIPEPVDADVSQDKEQEDLCLDHCLQQIAPDQRDLILTYYQDDRCAKIERRKKLAEELGLAIEELRLKIHRIKAKLRPCVKNCMAQPNIL